MPSYSIYEKPDLPLDQTIESAILVKNKFSLFAFLLPIVWMLVKRLWWVLLGYVIVLVPISLLQEQLPLWSSLLLTFLISLLMGLEASNLIGWSLERKGYQLATSLYAEDRDHAEMLYAEARLSAFEQEPPVPTSAPPASSKLQHTPDNNQLPPVIGLFPNSENA